MPVVLHCPVTGMYFCAEPYVVIEKRGQPALVLGREGTAVRKQKEATPFIDAEHARRRVSPGNLREFPEFLEV